MLSDTITDLDTKLANAVSKQEKEYLSIYSLFVQEKTIQLNDLAERLNDKAANGSVKDQKLNEMQSIVASLREDAARSELLNRERQEDLRKAKERLDQIIADRKFLYKHAREEKTRSMQLEKEVAELKEKL